MRRLFPLFALLLLLALPAAADARMPSLGQAFATAGDVGAQHTARLGADNLLIGGCGPSLSATRRCTVNPFDDDWDEGGLDCYYDVFVSRIGRRLRQETIPGRCNSSGGGRQDRAAPSKAAAFSLAARVGARHVERLEATAVMVEYCNVSGSRRRTCYVHAGGPEVSCRWEVTVVQRGRRVGSRVAADGCSDPYERPLPKAAS